MIQNYIENANFEDTGFAYTLSLISGKPESIVEPLKHIAALIHEKTGYNLWQERNIASYWS